MRPASSGSGYRAADATSEAGLNTQYEIETGSASVDIQDIIENYDGISSASRSFASNLYASALVSSQTYHTAPDDVTSFHSALVDGFRLSDYDLTRADTQPARSFWEEENMTSQLRESARPASHFQVYWYDLSYKIKPKISLASLWTDFESTLGSAALRAQSILTCRHYDGDANQTKAPVTKTILQSISGSFKSGELTAVMGPSGAGKTSLLNFLARRSEEGYTGQLYIDNCSSRLKISTIPQQDHLAEYLTVRENLRFASRLKILQCNTDHERNVERVSSLLGLEDCLDTMTKNISGGQQRRLAIAQELLSRPDMLILDEPTSGLDSLSCYKTLMVLKDLVKASANSLIDPIAIVVTIHQPQQEVFEIFDKIYVIANGGIAIYNGPPDRCVDSVKTVTSIEMPDEDYNPASFIIEIASNEYGKGPIDALQLKVNQDFQKNLELSNNKKALMKAAPRAGLEKNVTAADNGFEANSTDLYPLNDQRRKSFLFIDERIAKGSTMNRGSFFWKTLILSERCWLSIIRDPKQTIFRIMFHVLFPLGLALMMGTEPGKTNACPKFQTNYWLKDVITEEGLVGSQVQEDMLLSLENLGTIFVMIYTLFSASSAASTLSFTLDLQRSLKEFYNGWYSMPSYLIARIITDIPMDIVLPIISFLLTYSLTGQFADYNWSEDYSRIIYTATAITLGSMIGQTIGMIFGAIYIGHVTSALFASQGSALGFAFLSGFIVRKVKMSKMVAALSELSYYKHTLDITMIARYGYNLCRCDPETITGQEPKILGITDRLQKFIDYYQMNFEDQSANSTDPNLFDVFAKQISLYNAYGVEVKTCSDVKPYELHEMYLNESDLPRGFISLVASLIAVKLFFFLVVKLVIHFRTSL